MAIKISTIIFCKTIIFFHTCLIFFAKRFHISFFLGIYKLTGGSKITGRDRYLSKITSIVNFGSDMLKWSELDCFMVPDTPNLLSVDQ